MTIALILLGTVLGYFLVGALYARSQVSWIYRRAVKSNDHWYVESSRQYWIKQEVQLAIVPRIAVWPLMMAYDLCAGPGARWLMRPVTERQERAAKLRADAETWARQAEAETDSDKRIMAEELAKMLREQAKEVDF